MAAEDELAGFLIGAALIICVIGVILIVIAHVFAIVAGAGALWGLGVSSRNFFLAARNQIGRSRCE